MTKERIPHEVKNVSECIEKPAVRTPDGEIHTYGGRHETIITEVVMGEQNEGKGYTYGGLERGFLTSTGRFVGRKEAAVIAEKAGQISGITEGHELHSEEIF